MTSVTEVRTASARLFVGTWSPLVSVITTLYYVAIVFHRPVWYRALSLCYACIRSSGIILIPWATFVPNFVSFATSIAQLAHGPWKKIAYSITQSITHPAYVMPWEPKCLRFGIITNNLLPVNDAPTLTVVVSYNNSLLRACHAAMVTQRNAT